MACLTKGLTLDANPESCSMTTNGALKINNQIFYNSNYQNHVPLRTSTNIYHTMLFSIRMKKPKGYGVHGHKHYANLTQAM